MEKGYINIVAYDPVANSEFSRNYPNLDVSYRDSLQAVVSEADALVITTAWQEFVDNKELIDTKKVFDFRYISNPDVIPLSQKKSLRKAV